MWDTYISFFCRITWKMLGFSTSYSNKKYYFFIFVILIAWSAYRIYMKFNTLFFFVLKLFFFLIRSWIDNSNLSFTWKSFRISWLIFLSLIKLYDWLNYVLKHTFIWTSLIFPMAILVSPASWGYFLLEINSLNTYHIVKKQNKRESNSPE